MYILLYYSMIYIQNLFDTLFIQHIMLHIYIFNSHQYDSMMGLNLGYIAQVTSFEWGKG